jgi:hypothetical protein
MLIKIANIEKILVPTERHRSYYGICEVNRDIRNKENISSYPLSPYQMDEIS